MAITLEFDINPSEVVSKIKNAVLKSNGVFNGDDSKGEIKIDTLVGEVAANYQIIGKSITFEISKKPLFLSEELIKKEIDKYIK